MLSKLGYADCTLFSQRKAYDIQDFKGDDGNIGNL